MFNSFFNDALESLKNNSLKDAQLDIFKKFLLFLSDNLSDLKDQIYIPGYQIVLDNGPALLTHYNPYPISSPPHDHGKTWVIYGVVSGVTAMTEYEKINDKQAKVSKLYCLMPGQCALYNIGDIHSHMTYGDSKYIRLEGINLHKEYQGDKIYESVC